MKTKMVAPDGHRLSRRTPVSSLTSRVIASCQCRSEDARFYGEYVEIVRQHNQHLKDVGVEKVPNHSMACQTCGYLVAAYTKDCPACGARQQL